MFAKVHSSFLLGRLISLAVHFCKHQSCRISSELHRRWHSAWKSCGLRWSVCGPTPPPTCLARRLWGWPCPGVTSTCASWTRSKLRTHIPSIQPPSEKLFLRLFPPCPADRLERRCINTSTGGKLWSGIGVHVKVMSVLSKECIGKCPGLFFKHHLAQHRTNWTFPVCKAARLVAAQRTM